MKKTFGKLGMRKLPLAVAVSMLSTASAHAVEFNFGDLNVQFDNTVSYGIAMRTEGPDANQVMPGNGAAMGFTGKGSSYNYDDGTLNFKKNDIYSNVLKWSGDLELNYNNYGAFFRARAWYDYALMDQEMAFKPLNDATKDFAGKGAELLDAYVYGNFDIANTPVNVRLGRQVISWGESTFIQGGINSINPVDASAFRRPGAEVKDGLLPVNMLYTSIGLTGDLTLEAFYQLEWEKTRTDPCGTFFSTVDFVADGCGPVILGGAADERDIIAFRDAEIEAGVPLSGRVSPVTERLKDDQPKDSGQYGLALRWYTDIMGGAEFGLYYMNIHSRLPYISGVVTNYDATGINSGGVAGGQVNANASYDTSKPLYQIAYPEDIQIMGLSMATTLPNGASLGAEVSYRPDMPLQWNAFELILAGNGAPYSRLYQQRAKEAGGNAASLYGELAEGWDFFDIWQAQATYIQFYDRALGTDRITLAAEVGVTYVDGLPDTDKARYGRSGAYGIGNNDGVWGLNSVTSDTNWCSAPTNPLSGAANTAANVNTSNCTDDGYVTQWSGGIRLRAGADYNNAFAGVNMTPNVSIGYDKGYGPEPGAQFIDERLALSVGVNFVYMNTTAMSVNYTNFSGGKYDQLVDRDNIALSITRSF
ncbi:MAG: DUF1302 domain-containing protein [Bacterioplanes sp.]|nr:DUF1302 domain-containing protein [Bacterioplanes sp.]